MDRRKTVLEKLYAHYNRREYVHPDPLEFLYNYEDAADREIAGLVASSLAYGRVAQILKSADDALGRMGRSPRRFLEKVSAAELRKAMAGFKHRFADGDDVAGMLSSAGRMLKKYGSLEAGFMDGMSGADDIRPALCAFAGQLRPHGTENRHIIPEPACGSACKRLCLFLRWMVRKDNVDPGGWDDISPSVLIVPLDTHMHRIGRALGFTKRKQADMRTAAEITDALKVYSPGDPVKYDFALTRLGIRGDMNADTFVKEFNSEEAA
jgi:uncharacterized protein (TIGR02757 family)